MLALSTAVKMDVGSVAPKEADPATSLQVDTMILEYLCYNATKGLLAERHAVKRGEILSQPDSPELPLQMIDAFLPMFKLNHATQNRSKSLQLLLRILRFTTLFTRRYTPNNAIPSLEELQHLRDAQTKRAIAWYGSIPLPVVCQATGFHAAQPNFSMSRLRQARENACKQLSIPHDAVAFYASPSSPSLLDLLPMFLGVAAAINEIQGGNITQQLMDLAATFMQQAVLEQYLVFGSQGSELIVEAFAWGYRGNPPTGWADEELVNAIFCDEDLNQEVDGWADIHERSMNELKAEDGAYAHEHLTRLAARKPMTEFEDQVLGFLEVMLSALPTPDLTQLEAGQLSGMTLQQTMAFKENVRYHDMK